jgi:cyclopropane fatty-acyl-phospholipid synthase-like methyltransferase
MKMYNKNFAEIYDLLYSHKNYEKEVNYILSHSNGGALLDVGAGTLSHSVMLSAHFKRILATDFSMDMLDVGLSKINAGKIKNIDVFCGELDKIEDSFDTIISLFNVVNHILTMKEISHFFQLVESRMNEDGIFIFDAWGGLANIIDPPMEFDDRTIETGKGSIKLGVKTKTCFKSLIATMNMTATFNGTQIETVLRHRIWTMDVLTELLENAGLKIIRHNVFFDVNEEFSEFSRKIVFVCTKK